MLCPTQATCIKKNLIPDDTILLFNVHIMRKVRGNEEYQRECNQQG